MSAENYQFCDHMYPSQYRDELILLDTKQDKYIICSESFSKELLNLVSGPIHMNSFNQHKCDLESDIAELISRGIIEKEQACYPYYIDQKINSHGVSNVDWNLPLHGRQVKFDKEVFEALTVLIKVNFYMQSAGLYGTIQRIRKSRKNEINYLIPSIEELEALANKLNKACLVFPKKTKCLKWAMAFVLMALKRNWKCNLEIGVQNYPFMAHAWIECGGEVIMDSNDLRKGMAIILAEPFRRMSL